MALIQGLVDTQKQNLKSLGVVNAGDSLEIQLEVKERGGDIEFVNPIFELLAIKSDGTRVRQLVNIRYVGNIVIIEGDEQLVSCPGVVSLQLIINDNKRMSTCLFYFMCGKSFDRDIIQSIDKVGVLQELDSYVITMFSNLKEFEERIIEVDKTIRKLSEDMNEAEKVRGAAETKRQETFQAKQEEREKEYQESKLDKDNDYNLAEKNRDNLYKDAESSRNQLYLNEKSDRNNKFEQEKDDRKLEFNTLKAKMEEATNNSKNEENRRALTFTDLREAMEHLKSTMIENNNVMVNNESGRVAAETKRVADFNKMKEDNTTLGNNLTKKVDNKIIEIEKINEDFKKNISAQYETIASEFDKAVANVTNGNENVTNSEIVQARGKEVNLNARLTKFDSQLDTMGQQKANVNDVNNSLYLKADKTTTNEMQTRINSLASGSPKGTFATLSALQSDTNANTTNGKKSIYVVTSDGGWYYWNNTAWTKGGTYQGVGISDKSVTPQKIEKGKVINDSENLLRDLKLLNNLYDSRYAIDKKDIATTNTPMISIVDSTTSAISDFISVSKGDVIYTSTGCNVVEYNLDKTWNSQLRTSTPYTVKEDGFIRLSFARSFINTLVVSKNNDMKNKDFSYTFENLKIKSNQIIDDILIKNNNIKVIKKYEEMFFNKYPSTISIDNSFYPYQISYDDTYKYPAINSAYNVNLNANEKIYVYFDAEIISTNISSMNFDFYLGNANITKPIYLDGNKINFLYEYTVQTNLVNNTLKWGFRNFVVPDGENYQFTMRINKLNVIKINGYDEFSMYNLQKMIENRGFLRGNLLIETNDNIQKSDNSILSDEAKTVRNGWFGKKICTFGDSTIAQERWQPYMAKRLGCTYTNRGIGGTRIEILEIDDGYNNQSYTSDTRVNTIDTDADAIVIFGGFNDISCIKSVPFTDANVGNPSSWNYDATNMQGAISLLIKKIRTKIPKAKILICSPPWGFSDSVSRQNMHTIRKAMANACEYNGVDFVDMYKLCQWNYDNWQSYHPTGDSIHFDENDGAKLIAGIVCDALMKYEPWN